MYNMTDIQAALGLHQLHKLPEFHRCRQQIAERYNQAFGGFAELQLPVEKDWAAHAWHIYALRLNVGEISITRDQFISELQRRNIGTSVHFIPVHLLSYYRNKYGYAPEDFPVAYAEYQRTISLPCSPRMQEQDVQDVIEAVQSVIERHRPRPVFIPAAAAGA
jgi:dTDP-4-amino-4,6-dideoxygalactose transaminase